MNRILLTAGIGITPQGTFSQTADSRQQTADSRQQTADSRQYNNLDTSGQVPYRTAVFYDGGGANKVCPAFLYSGAVPKRTDGPGAASFSPCGNRPGGPANVPAKTAGLLRRRDTGVFG
jgi:hypothetical protein